MKKRGMIMIVGVGWLGLSGTSGVGQDAAPAEAKPARAEQNPVVVLETSLGTIRAELWPDKAPETVKNFLQYVDDGFYDGTIFHRVIRGFMIQGGGFTPEFRQKRTRGPVRNEAREDVSNVRGTLAMARTRDPHSATAQFYINHADNSRGLDKGKAADGFGYCVFGRVVEGMDVVDKIAEVETGPGGPFPKDVPTSTVLIRSIRRVSAVKAP